MDFIIQIRSVKLTAAFSFLFTSKARDLSFLRRCRWLRRSTWRRINARRPFPSFRRRRNIDKCKMVRKTSFSAFISHKISSNKELLSGKILFRNIDKCKMVKKRFFRHLSVRIMLKKELFC